MDKKIKTAYDLIIKHIPDDKVSDWKNINQDEKTLLITEAIHDVELDIDEVDSVLKDINKNIDSLKVLFIGVIVGVVGGLVSNVIHDQLSSFGFYYIVFVILLVLLVIYFLSDYMANLIDNKMSKSPLVDLWEESKKSKK